MRRLRASFPRHARLAPLVVSLSACGVEFDPASELTNLRVLAVKKSAPYARPGERVDLTLLWHDATPDRPPPQIAWAAVCENPPGDLFEACFAQPPDLDPAQLAARVSLPAPGAPPNDTFSFVTSEDLITSRPPPADPLAPPYGLTYVFFAICAGQLELAMGSDVPFLCYEELDGQPGFGADDRRLDSRDFIIGYSAVFAYSALRNENPRFTGIELGGRLLWPDAPAELALAAPAGAVLLPPRDVCVGESCEPATDGDAEPCPEELTLAACADEDDCAKPVLEAQIDPASAEVDAAASARGGDALGEQMWINYYASGGEIDQGVRLLNDAVIGFRSDVSTEYTPARAPQVSHLWAVAHDNRGGAEWARLRVCTR